ATAGSAAMRSSEASLDSGFSLAAPSADSCAPRACSISLRVGPAAGAGAGAAAGALAAVAGASAAGAAGGGSSWREQATNPKARRTVRTSERFIDSAHALHVGGHVADLFRCESLGEGQHHDAVAARLIRVRSRVTR